MRAPTTVLLFFLMCSGAAWGQATDASPSFVVATVKPGVPGADGRFPSSIRGGVGSRDPGQITYTGMSLKFLLVTAYAVQDYQIAGPAWLDTEHFDIAAKIPLGTTKEQFNLMLQSLLAERFHLALHRE